ncbi:unnamed protein product [Angiostrongylus costaricensis]|uniref:Uncharacterized protein n=1 Tax=Angiostrongylus costaricensis TaxID=334426 RepID=A0A0R3PXQ4_ANGCS|nr:unnamed protein product [Angiostrongylus costaricensis]
MILSLGLVSKIRDAERHRRKLTNVSMNNLSSSDVKHPMPKKICVNKKAPPTPSNFNFTQLQLQRISINNFGSKEYAPLSTEGDERREECVSSGTDDSHQRVQRL